MNIQYVKSVEDFFKHPKWGMNLLFGGICMLIPLIGQIVLSGWIITQFWAKRSADTEPDQSIGEPTSFPEFNFDHFVKYLKRGLWPFLVQLVAGLAIGLVIMILVIVVMSVIGAFSAMVPRVGAIFLPIFFLGGIVFYAALMIAINLVLVPLSLKATLTQSFNEAFDFAFAKNFISLVWKELIVASLFMFGLGIVMMIIGLIIILPTLGLGIYFLLPPVVFAWQHLIKQLYLLHLERGGIQVALSPELRDTPPALPPADPPAAQI